MRRVAPVAKPHAKAISLLDDARFTARVQKLVLVCLIQRFRFTTVPSSRFGRHQAVTVAPSAGGPVVFRAADGAFERVPVTRSMHQMATLD